MSMSSFAIIEKCWFIAKVNGQRGRRKDKKSVLFSVLGKMLAISGSSGVVGQGTGKVHLILYVGDLLGKKTIV